MTNHATQLIFFQSNTLPAKLFRLNFFLSLREMNFFFFFWLMKSIENCKTYFQELAFILNVLIIVLTTNNLKQYSEPKSYS